MKARRTRQERIRQRYEPIPSAGGVDSEDINAARQKMIASVDPFYRLGKRMYSIPPLTEIVL